MSGLRPCQQQAAGYTLIEFVIALTLAALIMLLLTGGLYLGTRSWEAVDGKAERVGETRQTLEFLRRELSAARGLIYELPDGEAPLFWGSREMLEWVAPLPAYVGSGGLSIMRLSAMGDGDKRQLVLDRWFFHPDVLEGKGLDTPLWTPLTPVEATAGQVANANYGRHILIEHLDDIEIAYFGAAEDDQKARWFEEWAGVAALPRLVRIRIKQAAEDWPEMVVEMPDPEITLRNVGDRS
ncbi:MAG: general secretion pathway protein GspJ [Chromatiaceae bacterium]|nr:general secretion pathway protein GspJ [Chromatiaceae bacterium]MCP5315380.1 general secretion pathway protein GspJ [Chromatiaceae bacterium]